MLFPSLFANLFTHSKDTIIKIIMYIYHALINALSAHTIHNNLNMILYTHIEHSSIQTTHTKHHMERTPPPQSKPQWIQMCMTLFCIHHTCARMHTHTNDCRRNYWLGQKNCEKRKVFSLTLRYIHYKYILFMQSAISWKTPYIY